MERCPGCGTVREAHNEAIDHLAEENAELRRQQEALVRFLGRDEFLRAIGEANADVIPMTGERTHNDQATAADQGSQFDRKTGDR